MENWECLQILKDHNRPIKSMTYWNGAIISCSLDGEIKVYFINDSFYSQIMYKFILFTIILNITGVEQWNLWDFSCLLEKESKFLGQILLCFDYQKNIGCSQEEPFKGIEICIPLIRSLSFFCFGSYLFYLFSLAAYWNFMWNE